MLKFDASIFGGELPVGLGVVGIAVVLPGGDFVDEDLFVGNAAIEALGRFEWHYTPKHGSWLNLAESELGVLTSQCLNRRIPNKQILIDEIAAWEHDRNANHTKADWQFTTKNARIKLKHLYPAIWLNQATRG